MANETVSPSMGLPIPGVGVTDGPTYATDVNNCFSIVDQHSHTPGSGVPITPSAMNINSQLPFNNNDATSIRSNRFYAQSSPLAAAADLLCLYVSGADLYYNDASGNRVRITQGGAVSGSAGTITGLPSGTASASFAASTFTFQAATNTAANVDGASFVFRNSSASSFGLTLAPPNAMGADYGLFLPALPASQKFMSLDAAGNMAATWAVDNSTLQVSGNSVQLKDGGITSAKLGTNLDLPGTSVQAGDKNVLVSNTNAASCLAVVRGTVNSSGAASAGEGFTCSVSSNIFGPTYVLHWSTAFASAPTVTITNATSTFAAVYCPMVISTSTTGAVVQFAALSGGTTIFPTTLGFNLIAMGPRT